MRHNIRCLVDNCESCQRLLPSKPAEPLITTTASFPASFPMEMISIDLFHVGHKNYMVMVDRYSGYFWVDLLRDLSTKAITAAIDKLTRVFGIPLSCRTDGGPQFRGQFEAYCKEQGIAHETSSPYNPRFNRHAEAALKAAKYLIIKTTPAEFPAALAAWRNTARDNKKSPNELLFGRKIRDTKPIALSHIHQGSNIATDIAPSTQQIPHTKIRIFTQGD